MPHPLDDARLKIVRAQEHFNGIDREIGAYIDSGPYHVPTQVNNNDVTVHRAVLSRQPDRQISCAIGDFVANLRAALDYVAWSLATKYAATAPAIGQDKIYFPLCDTLAKFTRAARSLANDYRIPAGALTVIESVQPYATGNDLFRYLVALSNQDKHCLPVLTVCYIETQSLILPVREDVKLTRTRDLFKVTFQPGGPFSAEQFAAQVKSHGQVSVFVAFDNPGVPTETPVLWLLRNMRRTVAKTVEAFEPFF